MKQDELLKVMAGVYIVEDKENSYKEMEKVRACVLDCSVACTCFSHVCF